ncbi:hypothetical protein E2C01_034470 [Portunus trituberculatus]|uniref:Uncharacterized protein n=1 Tax=Portunus trituberculatus TaxID=210409 RepID=A0A5B7F6C6_PORTR|nr:hypothetical protein [Portunus trituberculatus]
MAVGNSSGEGAMPEDPYAAPKPPEAVTATTAQGKKLGSEKKLSVVSRTAGRDTGSCQLPCDMKLAP